MYCMLDYVQYRAMLIHMLHCCWSAGTRMLHTVMMHDPMAQSKDT